MTSLEIEEELLRCMRCGECQAVCPTFSVTGREGEVARGKLRIVRALHQGDLGIDEGVSRKLSTCLLCKACCTACPSGVKVDKVIAAARGNIVDTQGVPFKKKAVLWGLEHPRVLSTVVSGARALRVLPRRETFPVPAEGYSPPAERRKVVFYAGCMNNHITPEIGEAVEAVLREAGYRVERIKESCCGVPAYYAGMHERAKKLAEKNLRNIRVKNRAVVTACPTCAVGLKGYTDFFKGKLGEKALELRNSTYDFSEFLASNGGFNGDLDLSIRVTFHDPCHALHGLGIVQESRDLMRRFPGIRVVEMEQRCCGFGGLFSLEHPDFSQTINEGRIRDIMATKAEAVVTSCPGCKYYIREGLRKAKKETEVVHIAELLGRGIR